MSIVSRPRQMSFDGVGDDDVMALPVPDSPGPVVRIGGQVFETTPVFDTYWKFAAERQQVYEARLAGSSGPWTMDQVLRNHRFTNCFRAADRVSQFLIRDVAYAGSQRPDELVFRVLLFKLFNKIDTWQLLSQTVGFPALDRFDVDSYADILDEAFAQGQRLYSAAYVVPPPHFGADRKHRNHLRLLRYMLDDGVTDRLSDAADMREAFNVLKSYPAMGDFLAFQFLIDINYTNALDFDEMDFVVAGPGARDGIRKCFGAMSKGREREIIEYMALSQHEHFQRLGLGFGGLFGRPLQLIDCQNLFCEVDKYARVMHPDIAGYSGRTRIKQKFRPVTRAVSAWFPPKWRLTVPRSNAVPA